MRAVPLLLAAPMLAWLIGLDPWIGVPVGFLAGILFAPVPKLDESKKGVDDDQML